ncbi:MAG: hypothetical protein ACI85I_000592, partial [Arenicella sp.]
KTFSSLERPLDSDISTEKFVFLLKVKIQFSD